VPVRVLRWNASCVPSQAADQLVHIQNNPYTSFSRFNALYFFDEYSPYGKSEKTRRPDFVFEIRHERAISVHRLLLIRMAKRGFLTTYELELGRDKVPVRVLRWIASCVPSQAADQLVHIQNNPYTSFSRFNALKIFRRKHIFAKHEKLKY